MSQTLYGYSQNYQYLESSNGSLYNEVFHTYELAGFTLNSQGLYEYNENYFATISLNGNEAISGGSPYTVIQVADTADSDVQLKVVVTLNGEVVDEGLELTSQLVKSQSGGSTRMILNADFVANRAGTYIVNYIAYDHAGNYTVQSSTFTVVSKATPVLIVNDYSSEMELGQAFIPQANIYANVLIFMHNADF